MRSACSLFCLFLTSAFEKYDAMFLGLFLYAEAEAEGEEEEEEELGILGEDGVVDVLMRLLGIIKADTHSLTNSSYCTLDSPLFSRKSNHSLCLFFSSVGLKSLVVNTLGAYVRIFIRVSNF